MSRKFEVSVESAVTVGQVFSAFADKDYWLARISAFGDSNSLDALVVDADGAVRVSAVQDLTRELLPTALARWYPKDLTVVRAETWRWIDGSRVSGQISVATDGAPASGRGTALLVPSGDGARLDFAATVEFNVPLVGGKIENYLASQLGDGIRQIQRFTTDWVTGQVSPSR
ncbi:DUF2505 domain-containing protein [Mycolicibacterium baixiangningiae]|uniref:DUF2505 domain-containing protein n=1 Tax=Mycolicibacterium baixiangningiae TaxID=2761578 RepID=UPI0018674A92|nr:DUF2505 domain-containing protein [Mycolicibacterium baixiangningiae]